MRISCSTILPTTLAVIGTCMCCICGYIAINETLIVLDEFGPIEGRGNPAKDAPPRYIDNPKTQEQELVNPTNPGNIFPSVVHGVQYYLIAIGVVVVVSSLATAFITYQSKNALLDAMYQGRMGSWANPRYIPLVLFYLFMLTIIWMLTSAFSVLPIVEFVITAQRCSDLDNPHFGLGVKGSICIDLVQYGLVPFREMHNAGYGLICGPGPHNPPWGNLEGLCKEYTTAFNLFIICFAGAAVVIIAMILYISRLFSLYNRMRMLFEEPPEDAHGLYKPHPRFPDPGFPGYEMSNHRKSQSLYNPSYEQNVLLIDPHSQEGANMEGSGYRVLPIPPGGDGSALKKEYFDGAGDRPASRNKKKSVARSSSAESTGVTESLLPTKRSRHPTMDSMEKSRPQGSITDVSKKGRNHVVAPPTDQDSDLEALQESSDAPSDHTQSTSAFRSHPKKRRSRSTRSDPNLYRKSSRRAASNRKPPKIDEYDSPPSDYYMQQDMVRRSSRMNSRARSEF